MRRFTKQIIILLNLAGALALCFAYLADFVNPARFWLLSFFGLAYPYILLINIFFLIFWLWRRKRTVFLSLIIILIGYSYIGRYFQIPHKQKIDTKTPGFTILTYNVRVFNYYKWENQEKVRDSILRYIKSNSPEIICLQEFYVNNSISELSEDHIKKSLSATPYCHFDYTYSYPAKKTNFGIATFSKHRIVHRGSFKFDNSLNACIYSDILINGDTIRVYNVHLESIHLKKIHYGLLDTVFKIDSRKINEVKDISSRLRRAYIARGKQVDMLVKHMASSPYPVILCGDFNDTPVSYTYRQLLGDKKDSYRETGSGFSNTYRGNLPKYRIDYIFYGDAFKSNDYKTGKIKLSDHFPVMCTLELKKQH